MHTFTFDNENFLYDDKPYTVISGAMHYFRIPAQYWYDRLLKLKECGFNTLETYTCWNLHEKHEGEFDFDGMLDLVHYIELAESLGLNVILRPGPYICAEWEMGGLPSWLLKYPDMKLRCNNPVFLEKAERYLDELLSRIKPHLITNGGNVIMMQIENEYGSFGNDHDYMRKIAEIYHKNGIDCLLYTSDGSDRFMLNGGTLDEYPCVVNFGSKPKENFDNLTKFRKGQPKMCGEYWVGWFDHWYEEHHTRDPHDVANLFKEMLDENASLNFYMFHGGTNFAFTNGANHFDKYEPTVTSYDYSALLSESGDRTQAYYLVRDIVKDYCGSVPELTATDSKKSAYGVVQLDESVNIFDVIDNGLSTPIKNTTPLYMEDIGQNFGYILYRTYIKGPMERLKLNLDGCHDRAIIYIDGKYVDYYEIDHHEQDVYIELDNDREIRLDILVENMGRANYGAKITYKKGLSDVRLGLQYQFGWEIYPLEMDNLSTLKFKKTDEKFSVSSFYRGVLNVDEPNDTFILLKNFKKGFVTVNGHNIGRYFNDAGPQQTLYVPGCWLKSGENEVIVFESDGCKKPQVEFVDTPIL